MYLVFDIGGTFVKYTYMTLEGNEIEAGKFKTPYESTETLIDRMYDVYQLQPMVQGIAISCPGTIDVDTGMVYHGGALTYLHEVNLEKRLEEKTGVHVSIENDAKCAALAELWQGSVKGHKNSVVLVIGTGLGGGVIINGALYRGAHLEAGEVSYVMTHVNPDTRQANFVAETISASKMVNAIAQLKGLDEDDGIGVFKYISNQDEEALAIFDQFCERLATQIFNLQYILDPEVFAIGGGISVQPVFLERLEQAMIRLKNANPKHVASPKLVTCHFRSAANLYGALYHHILKYSV